MISNRPNLNLDETDLIIIPFTLSISLYRENRVYLVGRRKILYKSLLLDVIEKKKREKKRKNATIVIKSK